MADKTYYAWSPIRYGSTTDQKGNFTGYKEIEVGDSVTRDKIGASKEEWAELKRVGVVRTEKHPDMGSFTGSPVEWYREQARKAANGEAPSMDEAGEEVEGDGTTT